MNFKNWFENKEEEPIIFLDLDETLVSTQQIPFDENYEEEMIKFGGVLIEESTLAF